MQNYVARPFVWAVALLAGTSLSSGVMAQTVSSAADAAATETGGDKSIVVTGFRKSYADAIATKRAEIAIMDGISSDGLGRFPDLNVGEALQRVPGVQINREAEGRNATINLRGLPGEYARLTLNGVAFAEPILTDAAPLGAFNSDIFSAIMVDKSPLANAQSGGLSGNVDLQIAPALRRKDGGFAKVSAEYNQLGKRTAPSGTLGYNHHFSDRFAVFGVLAYKHENFRRDTIQLNTYTQLSAAQAQANASTLGAYYATSAACPSCTGSISTKGVLYNSQVRQYSRINEGDLYTGTAGAQFEVNSELKLDVTGFYTDRNLPKTYQYLNIIDNNASSTITANGPVTALADGRYVLPSFSFSNAQATESTRQNAQRQRAWGVNGNLEWKRDANTVKNTLTISKSSNSSVETQVDFVTLQRTGGNGLNGSLNTGSGDLSNFALTLAPNSLISPGGSSWVWGGASDPTNWYDSATSSARTKKFTLTGTQSYANNQVFADQVSFEHKFEHGLITSVELGGRYEHNKFVSRGYRTSAQGIQAQNIAANWAMTSPTAGDFFGGNAPGYTTNWQVFDFNQIGNLGPVSAAAGATLSPLGYNIRYSDNNYSLYNFSNQTNIASVYGMSKFDVDAGSIRIRGNFGLRYEYLRNTVVALDRVSLTGGLGLPSDFKEHTYKQSYGKLLPSFIFAADLTSKLTLRGAAYRTYVRPQPRQFTPATIVGTPSNGIYTLTLGNPNLRPYDATSFDASLEWYNRPGGIVSVAAFQKRITGLIANVTDSKLLCPPDGTPYGLGTLTLNGDTCQSSLIYTGGATPVPYTVAATGYVNQPNPVTVRGVEFNLQQNFDFLPGFLSHFGSGMNYAYTTISGRNLDGSAATLPGVSKHNVNLIGFYETKLYGLRLVYNYRSSYDLASAGTFTGAARSVRPRGQLDLSASVNPSSWLSLSLDAYNLTNALRYEYENAQNLPRKVDYDGRTFTLTARATF